MKIVFCLNDFGSRTYNVHLAKAAILSAKYHLPCEIVCIFDGHNPYFEKFLTQYCIKVIKPGPNYIRMIFSSLHSSSGFWEKDTDKIINFATGAFLRFEISNYLDDDYCLYADVDTLFTEKFKIPDIKPKIMAMCRQDFSDDADFNSGIILFNLKEFKKMYKKLVNVTCKSYDEWIENMYDQYVVNNNFKNEIEDLDMTYNWRPNFGVNDDAQIIHYERVKPLQTHAGVYESLRNSNSYKYYEDYFFKKLEKFNI
ncbi:hypothetical protein N9948_01470 [bacterium]|nr:hypothetical protein [bacterium]